MAVAKVGGKLSAEDYALMPDDGNRYELIEGELRLMPSPESVHQRVSKRLLYKIDAEATKVGAELLYAPLDVYLGQNVVLQPDLVLVTAERSHLITRRGVEGAPDLVVEILSPGNPTRDRITKARLYAQAGVRELWLVSPEAAIIEVFALHDGIYNLHCRAGDNEPVSSTVLPQLSFPASDAFE
jgi:Uma2 family endonuclease